VTDRPAHDHRYAIDSAKIAGELGVRAARDVRKRHRPDGRLVCRQWRLVAPGAQRRFQRLGAPPLRRRHGGRGGQVSLPGALKPMGVRDPARAAGGRAPGLPSAGHRRIDRAEAERLQAEGSGWKSGGSAAWQQRAYDRLLDDMEAGAPRRDLAVRRRGGRTPPA
jgi:hypothetical protein